VVGARHFLHTNKPSTLVKVCGVEIEHHCPGRKSPCWAVKRPAHPYKITIQK
jgi:hypothetical protein